MTFKEQTKHSKADSDYRESDLLAAIKEAEALMQNAVSCDPIVAAMSQPTTAP